MGSIHRKVALGSIAALAVATLAAPTGVRAQPPALDRVLAFPPPIPGEELHADRGAQGAWHRIRKLATTASLLHVTAHPDDEHAGTLTLASRGWGARTALLSLNRGEAGANAIGPELFDALGLIRTRELVLSGRHYGLDDLYFTTAVDYGYSKTVAETFRSWDREAVLEDLVRVIRLNRPLVVVSRFHGSVRDGHGNHHAAGVLTPEAVVAAADPERFAEQIEREGLRAWQVLRLYRGGVRLGEPFDLLVDANGYAPSLGMTYERWANLGLSLQRSQTSGRVRDGAGRTYRYERTSGMAAGPSGGAPDRGVAHRSDGSAARDVARDGGSATGDFFAGLDTRLTGLPALVGEEVGPGVAARLAEVQAAIDAAVREFDFAAPEASVAALARGLALLRAVTGGEGVPVETGFHLAVKERQFEDAIVAAAGVVVAAEVDPGAGGAVVVPGEVVDVAVRVESAAPGRVQVAGARVVVGGERVALSLTEPMGSTGVTGPAEPTGETEPNGSARPTRVTGSTEVRIPAEAESAGPYFGRDGLEDNHYQIADSTDLHLAWGRPRFVADVELLVDGVKVAVRRPVVGMAPNLPYGLLARRVAVLPAVSVTASPGVLVAPTGNQTPLGSAAGSGGSAGRAVEVLVRVEANAPDLDVQTRMELPAGWTATPASTRNRLRSRGESAESVFALQRPAGWRGEVVVEAVARVATQAAAGKLDSVARATRQTASGRTGASPGVSAPGTVREYHAGLLTIDHRDLPLARLHRPARTTVRSVETATLNGLLVGYVMGVGDEVPFAIEALGATVRLLDEDDLAGGELSAFDAVVVGTRAYAVRRDLVDNNQRLLDYARGGGNVVVLYQTQEFAPSEMAPYPASLPRSAEEVSEEDAPVRLLDPAHPLLATPNRIVEADFAGWLEQRGSKFFADWDSRYIPLVETSDTGQEPQRGVWLAAVVGDGRYSYLALALHRQLPFGVPGAYRILTNALWPRSAGR